MLFNPLRWRASFPIDTRASEKRLSPSFGLSPGDNAGAFFAAESLLSRPALDVFQTQHL